MVVMSGGEVVFSRLTGIILWSVILLGLVIGLSQLEQILRSSRNPLRYQLKFVIIGLGGLAGISIVQASQMLLLPIWKQDWVWVGGVATCVSLTLLGFGLGRWRVKDFSQKVHVSHQALYTSISFLFVGGYLIIVGVMAELIQQTGWEMKEAIGVLIVFLAGLGLVVVMVSRQARAELQQFIGRHFYRTKYDYRQKWLEVTEAFTACQDVQQIWDRYLELVSRTFGAPRITIWKKFETDGHFHQIRSINTVTPPAPIPSSHFLIESLAKNPTPIILDTVQVEDQEAKDFLGHLQAHVCVPLLGREGNLVGFCTLSKELHDRSYDQDDFDLLRAIAHHVMMLIIQFELVEERGVTAKWEAVHRFSGFYLHDLKNLTSSLSMVVQNSEQYGNDPDFQAAAMRTVRNTSQRMMELMSKLANQSKAPGLEPNLKCEPIQLNTLVRETLDSLNGTDCKPVFHPGEDLPVLYLNLESTKQVLLNLLLNAQQAISGKGTIDISTSLDGDHVSVVIVDTGSGIPASQLENLFQPFKSSKKTGLGVGLFQCKRMIEDQNGRIRVESEQGRGTKVFVTFPVK